MAFHGSICEQLILIFKKSGSEDRPSWELCVHWLFSVRPVTLKTGLKIGIMLVLGAPLLH